MHSDDLDDLFRSQLGGHETPPGDDLWARLAARAEGLAPAAGPAEPAAEQVDHLFQTRLSGHATPPRRELWERLEDEHLRPRKRRAAAWWPMAMAAAVALLLLAGGAGLWLGFSGSTRSSGTLATQPAPAVLRPAASTAPHAASEAEASRTAAGSVASVATPAAAAAKGSFNQASKNFSRQATRAGRMPSSASKAGTMAAQSPIRTQRQALRLPDAAAAPASLLAQSPRTAPAPTFPLPSHTVSADEPALVVANVPLTPTAAPGNAGLPAPALATATSIISVDVRSGASVQRPSLGTAVAAASAEAGQSRGLGGRLLHQVSHVLRGERLSLAEVTGLPQNLTVEAGIGNRRVSTSIQL